MILILENAINWDTLEQAKEMIRKGKELTENTGVKTMSKFQLFGPAQVVNKEHLEYCSKRMLTFEQAKELFEYGNSIGQEVFFTCMAPEYVGWCEEIGVRYYKVRFYDRKNEQILQKIEDTKKEFFISMENTDHLVHEYINKYTNIKVLYCVPKYPAKKEDYPWWALSWNGISDHTPDLELYIENMNKKRNTIFQYWERHVCLTKDTCLEREWASTFEELEEVLHP